MTTEPKLPPMPVFADSEALGRISPSQHTSQPQARSSFIQLTCQHHWYCLAPCGTICGIPGASNMTGCWVADEEFSTELLEYEDIIKKML